MSDNVIDRDTEIRKYNCEMLRVLWHNAETSPMQFHAIGGHQRPSMARERWMKCASDWCAENHITRDEMNTYHPDKNWLPEDPWVKERAEEMLDKEAKVDDEFFVHEIKQDDE